MKKWMAIFSVLIFLIAFCACDLANEIIPQTPEVSRETQDELTESYPIDVAVKDDMEEDVEIRNSAAYVYMSFDELLRYSTDIVKARFIRVTMESNGMYHYEFEVIESVRGLGLEQTLTVDNQAADCYITDTNITFSTYDVQYEYGKCYLLLLQRWTSVYKEGYSFGFVSDSLIIPIDEDGKSYLASNESLLYGSNLSNHLGSVEIADEFEKGTFEQYAVNSVKENPMVLGDDYIKSTVMSDVLCGSEYVLEVTVKFVTSQSYNGDRATYRCEVMSVYKGNYTEKTPKITFPAGTVEVGETYIVAVNAGDSQAYLTMSSKNSVYSTSQREEIISTLSE